MGSLTINATEFKARCLAILDEVNESGGSVTVTKRGRPVAVIGPPKRKKTKSLKGALAGKVYIPDDVLDADYSHLWNAPKSE